MFGRAFGSFLTKKRKTRHTVEGEYRLLGVANCYANTPYPHLMTQSVFLNVRIRLMGTHNVVLRKSELSASCQDGPNFKHARSS